MDQRLFQLMEAPVFRSAVRSAETRAANRSVIEGFKPVRNPFEFAKDGTVSLRRMPDGSTAMPSLQFWDQVKRNLDGMIDRTKDRTMRSDLVGLKNELLGVLDNLVPQYRQARAGAASFFGAEDALEAGRMFARQPRAVPEARQAFGQFTPAERQAFQTGYASELIDRIGATRDRVNLISQIFETPASREMLEMIFGPQKMRQIEAYVRVENLADMLRGAMGNSTTARQLMELGIGAGSGAVLSGGDWRGALGGAALARGGRMLGQRIDNNVMQLVARMLTSGDRSAIDRAVAQAAKEPAWMGAITAMSNALALPARTGALAIAAQN